MRCRRMIHDDDEDDCLMLNDVKIFLLSFCWSQIDGLVYIIILVTFKVTS
uniref:Transmembrane protein n=1 Tax=Octopus bimaculoides TaxID=37653 RepID=A0A0L8GY07_OCTBM